MYKNQYLKKNKVEKIYLDLAKRLEDSKYVGWDHVDILNSRIINKSMLFNNKYFRLILLQLFKKSPLNLREQLLVKKGINPKGLALIMSSYINYYIYSGKELYLDKAKNLGYMLEKVRSKDRDYYCWGYNFFWESLAFSVPRNKPNIIVSSFICDSLIDLYEIDTDDKWLSMIDGVITFILKELIIFENDKELCFGYIPGENAKVHNANLFGARIVAKASKYLSNPDLLKISEKSINYTVNRQNENGSWYYGEMEHWKWIDNFHTGYNLVAINDWKFITNNADLFSKHLEKGLKYHIKNHYTENFTPKYFDNSVYPVDIHNYAQSIITFKSFGMEDYAERILYDCISKMYDNNKKYFYYQITKYFTNKIEYMRWSQAWMCYAISIYLYK